MNIRKADINDIKLIVDIWEEFESEHDGIVTSRNHKLKEMNLRSADSAALYEKFLQANIKSGNGAVFIAEADGRIAGYALGFIKDEIPIFQLKRYGHISDLYVRKEFRGKGLSSKLKDEMILWFRSQGVQYASIGFYANNHKAREIYRKWDFFDYKVEARKKI